MTKRKISATIDPDRLEEARALAGRDRPVSEVLDLAIAAFVTQALEERWLAAHSGPMDVPDEVFVDLSDVPWEH